MSASAVCGWRPATGAADPLSCRKSRHAAHYDLVQRLAPVTGLVNRTDGLQARVLRWQQRTKQSTRVVDVKHSWRAQGPDTLKAKSINESQFEAEVLQSSLPVLVDFWASWCGPCRLMGITLDWAAQEYAGKINCVKIETDLNEGLVDKYKVYGLPTLIVFVNGQALPNSQREGALNKEKLKAYLESNLPALAPTAS